MLTLVLAIAFAASLMLRFDRSAVRAYDANPGEAYQGSKSVTALLALAAVATVAMGVMQQTMMTDMFGPATTE